VHVEGDRGTWVIRRDATKIGAFGTRMLYDGDTNFLGDDTLAQVANRLLDERTEPTTAIKVNIEPLDNDTPCPYTHFFIGDTYPLDLTGDFTGSKRVVKIATDFTPGHGRYTVEFDNTSYTSDPLKAVTEAVRRLLEKVDELDAPADTSTPDEIVIADANPIEPTYLVAASDSRTEIQNVADYVCDGTGDEEEIALALADASTLAQARVVLAEGTYTLTASAALTIPQDVHLMGMGAGATQLTGVSGSEATLNTGIRSTVSHLMTTNVTITAAGGFTGIDNVIAVGSLTQNYVVALSSTGARVSNVYASGGAIGAFRINSNNNIVTNLTVDLAGSVGLYISGARNIIHGAYIASPDDEGVEITSAGIDNVLNNVTVSNPWQGAGSGAAVLIGGDRTVLNGFRVGASASYTYAFEISATADATILGVYGAIAGTSGTVNDLGTNTYDYRNPTITPTAGLDSTAIHDNVASEISAITAKGTPVSGDFLVIEDSAAANVKKSITIGDLPGGGAGSDTTAIHDDTASEISAITEKVTPVSADLLVIEDSAAANVKKRVQVGNLPTGGGLNLTVKGQIHTHDTGDAALTVGANDEILVADSAQATGLDWKTMAVASEALLTTKGDVPVNNGTTVVRLPVGTNDYVLTADSAQTEGIKWAAAAGGSGYIAEVIASGTPATMSFTSIPTGHKDLKIVGLLRSTRTSFEWDLLEVNVGNGTIDTGASSYSWAYVFDGSSTNNSFDVADSGFKEAFGMVNAADATAGEFSAIEMTIYDYERTAINRRVRIKATFLRDSAAYITGELWGQWIDTTNVIDIITFDLTNGNFVNDSYLRLYGGG
jgi:hypothetical protein